MDGGREQTESGFGTGLRAHLEQHRDPQPEPAGDTSPPEVAAELAERVAFVAAAEAELLERERLLAEREAALRAEARRLAELGEAQAATPPERRYVRELLRERAEQHGDRIWRSVEGALEATRPDGRPDHETRLTALRLLLAEAYDADRRGAWPIPDDELGRLRERRTQA